MSKLQSSLTGAQIVRVATVVFSVVLLGLSGNLTSRVSGSSASTDYALFVACWTLIVGGLFAGVLNTVLGTKKVTSLVVLTTDVLTSLFLLTAGIELPAVWGTGGYGSTRHVYIATTVFLWILWLLSLGQLFFSYGLFKDRPLS